MIDITEHGSRVFQSKGIIDQRLVNIYRLKRFKEDFKIHKGKECRFIKEETKDVKDIPPKLLSLDERPADNAFL